MEPDDQFAQLQRRTRRAFLTGIAAAAAFFAILWALGVI